MLENVIVPILLIFFFFHLFFFFKEVERVYVCREGKCVLLCVCVNLLWKSGHPIMLTPAVTLESANMVCHVEWPPSEIPRQIC